MSTIAYAQLTNAREAAPSGTSTTTSSPGLRTYIDAFAALVPAEVLTLHALVVAATTTVVPATKDAEASTSIVVGQAGTLCFAFWGMVALSIILFAVPRYVGGKMDKFDGIRIAIAPLSFVGWTMLQRATAFDAAFPNVEAVPRTVIALFLGAVLGGVTAALALKADAKTPAVPAPVPPPVG